MTESQTLLITSGNLKEKEEQIVRELVKSLERGLGDSEKTVQAVALIGQMEKSLTDLNLRINACAIAALNAYGDISIQYRFANRWKSVIKTHFDNGNLSLNECCKLYWFAASRCPKAHVLHERAKDIRDYLHLETQQKIAESRLHRKRNNKLFLEPHRLTKSKGSAVHMKLLKPSL